MNCRHLEDIHETGRDILKVNSLEHLEKNEEGEHGEEMGLLSPNFSKVIL